MLFKCGGGAYNYENLKTFEEEKEIDGIKVKTINAQGLWFTKQTNREKDALDLLFLNVLLKHKGLNIKENSNDKNEVIAESQEKTSILSSLKEVFKKTKFK